MKDRQFQDEADDKQNYHRFDDLAPRHEAAEDTAKNPDAHKNEEQSWIEDRRGDQHLQVFDHMLGHRTGFLLRGFLRRFCWYSLAIVFRSTVMAQF